MADADLRVAVVGFGLAGATFHAPLVAATPGLRIAAVVTGDPERGRRAGEEHPGARVVADAPALWALRDELDVVVVAAPNRAHVPVALAAIEHGLAVVVDKPLAVTAGEAERVVAAARAAGVPLTVFHNRRWDGDFLTVRALAERGELGALVRLESRFERFRPEIRAGAWRERGDAAEGGGLLLDLGSHLVDQATALLGPPVRVYAELDRRRPGAQVEDDAFVALEHAGGARSHLWMSAVAPLHGPRLRLSGTRAGVETAGLDPQEAQLRDGLRPGDPGWGAGAPVRVADADGAREVPGAPGRWEDFYAGVRDAVRDGAPPPVDPGEAVALLRVLEAARRSALEAAVVALQPTPRPAAPRAPARR
jgi:predicted dehydrogenase